MQISVNKLLGKTSQDNSKDQIFFPLFLPRSCTFSLFWIPTRQKLGFNHPFACVFAYACCPYSQKNNESLRDGKRERDKDSERWGKYLSALMSSQSSLAGLSILFCMRVLLEASAQGVFDLILLLASVAGFALRLAADRWKSLSARRTPSSCRSLSSLCLAWTADFMASFASRSELCSCASSRSCSSLAWASSASLCWCRSWTLACRSPRSTAIALFASCNTLLSSRKRMISLSRETIWLCNCSICESKQRHVKKTIITTSFWDICALNSRLAFMERVCSGPSEQPLCNLLLMAKHKRGPFRQLVKSWWRVWKRGGDACWVYTPRQIAAFYLALSLPYCRSTPPFKQH